MSSSTIVCCPRKGRHGGRRRCSLPRCKSLMGAEPRLAPPASSARSYLAAAPRCLWQMAPAPGRGPGVHPAPRVAPCRGTSGLRRPASGGSRSGAAPADGSEAGPQRMGVACTGSGNASILSRPRSAPARARWCQRLGDPGGEVVSRKSSFSNTSEGDDQEKKLSIGLYGGKSSGYTVVRPPSFDLRLYCAMHPTTGAP